jgi:hypothetical protein
MMDAVRIKDGAFVMLKQVSPTYHPNEVEIGQYLDGDALRQEASNHTVPLLDVLQVPNDDAVVLLVMPMLRKFDDPPFGTLGEVVECVKQAFEVRLEASVSSLLTMARAGCSIHAQSQHSSSVRSIPISWQRVYVVLGIVLASTSCWILLVCSLYLFIRS